MDNLKRSRAASDVERIAKYEHALECLPEAGCRLSQKERC